MHGDGWRLSFTDHAGPARLTVTDWLVVGPFENESGGVIDKTVHPPELKLDVTARYETRDGVEGLEADPYYRRREARSGRPFCGRGSGRRLRRGLRARGP